ncbi:hypothetical protein [Nocardia sp. NPDC057440]|uniref:hypothetical protein n=1 Tax=Nocardia sp. NPDC057440 TaxID=3346134 RepID=UPI00366E242B
MSAIHEQLDEYIADILKWAAVLDSNSPGNLLRVQVFQLLRDLSFISLSPDPVPGLVDLVNNLRSTVIGRVLADSYDGTPAGQIVFRYQSQVAKDLEVVLARCGEEVLP